jgi:hypothetical protein
VAEQVVGHEIPAGLLVTLPAPDPAMATVNEWLATNVAVTAWSAFMVTVHVPVPEQPPPLQPVNVHPGSGLAPRVTFVPDG